MKKIFTCLLLAFSLPSIADTAPQTFGDAMPEAPDAVTLGDAIASLDTGETVDAKIAGKITEVCAKKGCWMVLTDGSDYARVRFKDYSFFVPTDSDGHEAVVMGSLTAKQISADEANHYEKDAGREGKYRGEQREYSIMASSVVIR